MGVGGLEMPTGTIDHPFGQGAFGEIAAGLFSVEKRPIAAIAYVYYHHRGVHDGLRDSGNTFAGGGLAYTPIDDDATGKLFSMQLGRLVRADVCVETERPVAARQRRLWRLRTSGDCLFRESGTAILRVGLAAPHATVEFRGRPPAIPARSGIIWILKHSGT